MCFLAAADEWGRLFVGGASLIGIGSLCYYGLGLAKEEGAIDRARCVCVCVCVCVCACVRVYPVYKYFAHLTPFHWHSLILQSCLYIPCRFWPQEVRDRVRSTYGYFAGGLGVTALAAAGASRATSLLRFMSTRPMLVREGVAEA